MQRSVILLVWYVVCAAAFILAAGVVIGLPVWLFGEGEWSRLRLLVLALLISSVVPVSRVIAGGKARPSLLMLLTFAPFAAVWFLAPGVRTELPAAGILALAAVAFAINLRVPALPRGKWHVVALPGCLGMFLALSGLLATWGSPAGQWMYYGFRSPLIQILQTAVYPVQHNRFRAPLARPAMPGGGIAVAGENMVLVTGDGDFYRLVFSSGGERLAAHPLGYQAPINADRFRRLRLGSEVTEWFRVYGILLLESRNAQTLQVLVAHHYWHEAAGCFVLRLSSFASRPEVFFAGGADPKWRTLFETSPCLPLKVDGRVFFIGRQAGGRLLQLDSRKVLLTVGDHAYDGVYATHIAAQDMDSSYGKIVEVDTGTGAHRMYSSGHRNSQGLYRDGQGQIWSTEQGPQGGDELNLISEGGNYGWPFETFGTNYGHFTWPALAGKDPARSFNRPVFAWVPSIAASNLIGIEKGVFKRWSGDLIVSSLVAKSLYRMRIDRKRPVFVEPIEIGERIRDLATDAQGRIVLWTDSGSIDLLFPLEDGP